MKSRAIAVLLATVAMYVTLMATGTQTGGRSRRSAQGGGKCGVFAGQTATRSLALGLR